ncbi:MAG TPA: 2-C-methyl-D-erythritol 2,4-cyclodiphosphate synthase [Lentisphaeria bacterium]|nr:MAG: 2-C-methyl-D-erythritol 2,4-cyclodiphosphate synthase [Lentisphaerae bacterium GWF2_38_69]HBM15919.1 2-C-methyl-D-erythritol 2,4-cyclodiphosphate synthase [Lentisphaeria bacterium]
MQLRIGQGFDAHKFIKGKPFILGGVRLPYEYGLDGHSDADVLTHAIIDSLLGALSLGNIGTWFPDNDPKFKNADSMELLKKVLLHKTFKAWKILNIDSTIIAQKPKLSPYIEQIHSNLAELFSLQKNCISVKPKTTEGMGFCGREEGIAVLVNTLIIKN